MNWFEKWFDSPLYERLYAYRNKNEANNLVDLIEREIPVSDLHNVMETMKETIFKKMIIAAEKTEFQCSSVFPWLLII